MAGEAGAGVLGGGIRAGLTAEAGGVGVEASTAAVDGGVAVETVPFGVAAGTALKALPCLGPMVERAHRTFGEGGARGMNTAATG